MRILSYVTLFLLASGCGSNPPEDVDASTERLLVSIDNSNPDDIRDALSLGARADAAAGFGNNAMHFAARSNDPSLLNDILNHLATQKSSATELVDAISAKNKESQTALEIAVSLGHKDIINAFGSFCENRRILRSVFFPVAKKNAGTHGENLDLLLSAISHFGKSKKHMPQLIFETIGTKEGQIILQTHDESSLLVDFARAYLMAFDAGIEIQNLFFKVASGFRIEKRSELIGHLAAESANDLYRNFDRQISDLEKKFGVIRKEPVIETKEQPKPHSGVKSNDETKLPADQNAVLRDAVLHNDTAKIHEALEHGARIDALDANLETVFHIAARINAANSMTVLLSQLQCSNAGLLLLQKDADGLSPFLIAAHLPKDKNHSLKALSEFFLAAETCQEIAKKEIREWVKSEKEEPIKNVFSVFSEISHGIEVISDIAFRLMGGISAQQIVSWIDQTLCTEARDHVWARAYLKTIEEGNEIKKSSIRNIVSAYSESERRQIVGFMLFLSSGKTSPDLKNRILSEVDALKLPRSIFEGSSDNVSELKAALDEIVTGQEAAKVSLSVAIKNHYERVKKGLKKSNILILGPSGTGKTLLVQTIAKTLDVPFTIFDATNITQAGYVGGKASDAIGALAEKGGYKKEKIERGIIFLDEIDKMASRSGRSESDEFKRQGQASILKMLEGIEVEVQVGRFDSITIDTSNILFVCAGAFTGLPEIIDSRLKTEGLSLSDNVFGQAIADDLIRYGMAPELLGRLPNVIALKQLNVEDMVHILNNPKSSVLEEYRSLFLQRNVEILFTEGAIRAIAERAVTYNVGARALRTVAESVISDLQFRIGQMGMLKSITVTERVVKYGDMPTLEYLNPDDNPKPDNT